MPKPIEKGDKLLKLLNVTQVAKKLGCTRDTVYAMLKRGDLPEPIATSDSGRTTKPYIQKFWSDEQLKNIVTPTVGKPKSRQSC